MEDVTLVIFAGGRGRRLGKLTEHCPKPMLSVQGKPFLAYTLDHAISQDIRKAIICVGYLHEQISGYFQNVWETDAGRIDIEYTVDPVECETALRLKHAAALVETSQIIAVNGDTLVQAQWQPLLNANASIDAALVLAPSNRATFKAATISSDLVTDLDAKNGQYFRHIGATLLKTEYARRLTNDNVSLEQALLPTHFVNTYTTHYFEIGTLTTLRRARTKEIL